MTSDLPAGEDIKGSYFIIGMKEMLFPALISFIKKTWYSQHNCVIKKMISMILSSFVKRDCCEDILQII